MERPKQTLDWLGSPLVAYQLRQLLEAGLGQVVVVLGHEIGAIRPLVDAIEDERISIVNNPGYRSGKTSSITAGLRQVGPEAGTVLLLAADQPRPAALLRRIVEEHVAVSALVSIPAYRGKHGHPPVFDASLIPELLLITEEGEGIREVIQRHSDGIHEVAIDDPLVLTNLNTPEDYDHALALATGRESGAQQESGS